MPRSDEKNGEEGKLPTAHLALKLDSLPAIIRLARRVDEALEVDGEGTGRLKGQLTASNGALDAPTLCQGAICDVALVLHSQYILSREQDTFIDQQLESYSSPRPWSASCSHYTPGSEPLTISW